MFIHYRNPEYRLLYYIFTNIEVQIIMTKCTNTEKTIRKLSNKYVTPVFLVVVFFDLMSLFMLQIYQGIYKQSIINKINHRHWLSFTFTTGSSVSVAIAIVIQIGFDIFSRK